MLSCHTMILESKALKINDWLKTPQLKEIKASNKVKIDILAMAILLFFIKLYIAVIKVKNKTK